MTTAYHSLASGNFSQDWSDTSLLSTNDSWDNVASIVGYRGDGLTGSTSVNPATIIGTSTVVDVNVNQTNPNTFTTAGVTEFQLANPTIALAGSGTAKAPYIAIHLDGTGRQDITLSFTARDLEFGGDNAIQQIAVQYRIGDAGPWITITRIGGITEITPAERVRPGRSIAATGQPSSSNSVSAPKPAKLPSLPPADSCSCRRPKEPACTSACTPSLLKPLLVRSEIAPPRVLSPNSGLEPGKRSKRSIAFSGIRSQFTTSAKASLTRTPSMKTDRPCGVPSCGLALKPRYCRSIWKGLPW